MVRPLAVYHSYDVETGRAVWVSVKGNSNTREQICDALEDQLHSAPAGSAHTFASTLTVHISILENVEENWQSYINEMDHEVRTTVYKASHAKIDIGPHFEHMQQSIKQQIARPSTNNISGGARVGSLLQSIKSGFQKSSSKQNLEKSDPTPIKPKGNDFWWKKMLSGPSHMTPSDQKDEIQNILDKYLKLDNYSFEDNQNLHRYGEAIQEAILTIKLNANVIRGLRDFYQCQTLHQSVFKDDSHPDIYQAEKFIARLESLENSLRIKHEQLESLEKFVKEAKVLVREIHLETHIVQEDGADLFPNPQYDGVSQYRSVQISKIYAQSAQASAQRMEKIAGITEKETASMHIITFVTLVFLPGTFIAVRLAMPSLSRSVKYLTTSSQSFLQSGVFQWKDEDSLEKAWLFRGPVFEMFITICLVMMFLTFVVWFLVFRCLRGRSQGHDETVDEKDVSEMV